MSVEHAALCEERPDLHTDQQLSFLIDLCHSAMSMVVAESWIPLPLSGEGTQEVCHFERLAV